MNILDEIGLLQFIDRIFDSNLSLENKIATLIDDVLDKDKKVHEPAMAALIEIGEPAIQPILHSLTLLTMKGFSTDKHTIEQIRLGKVLGGIGVSAWEPLMDVASRRPSDNGFGWTVAWAMGNFVDKCATTDFIEALNHKNIHVRWSAALNLQKIKDPLAIDALERALSEPANEEPLHKLAGKTSDGRRIYKIEDDYHEKVRQCAAKALGELGESGLEVLSNALKSDNPMICEAAAFGLRAIQDSEFFDFLVEPLHSSNPKVRVDAIEAMRNILDVLPEEKKHHALDLLISQLHHDTQRPQTHATKPLAKLGAIAVDPLIDIVLTPELDLENQYTRYYAAVTLSQMLHTQPEIPQLQEKVYETMSRVLKEKDQVNIFVRRIAASLLGHIGDKRALEILLPVLDDTDYHTLLEVVGALEKLRDKRAIQPIERLLHRIKDDDGYMVVDELKYTAKQILGILKEEQQS